MLAFFPGGVPGRLSLLRAPPAMFTQQHFQQQLLQLQQLLQQQQQQPPQQQTPPSRGVTPSQQQQILNMRATGQASPLSANPMLQRALLIQQMQGNLRGFNMAAAPVLQQFFPQATRHSLLGPPPVGVSLKPARLAFPAMPFQWQSRTFRKDFPRIPERKREADSSSSSSQGQGADESGPDLEVSDFKVDSKDSKEPLDQNCSHPSETPAESSPESEPAAKRLKSVEESVPTETVCLLQVEDSITESHLEEADNAKENLAADASEEKNFVEELKTSEVVSSAGSLKVTIQQSSESRAISTTALKPTHWTSEMGTAETSPESVLKFYCYICKSDCCNQQNFQAHMAGVQHQQRLQDIQHMSNVCFVSLLPMVKEQRPLVEKDRDSQQRWCNTCQTNFIGDLIKHRRTQDHKLAKRSLRPLCTVCSRHFKTPRKFVEHMKSFEHKQKAKEMRLGEKEQSGPEDSEELITVDAVGCFEEEEEEEDDDEEAGEGEELEQLEHEEPLTKQAGLKEISLEDTGGNEKYCPDTVYGPDFLVPVAGFLCRLCHKFYHSDSAGRLAHCKSLMHFENLQRYKATRLQAPPLVVEAPLHPRQELHDRQTAAAKIVDKTEMTSGIKEAPVQTESYGTSREEPASAAQSSSPETDEVHSIPAEESGDDGRKRLLAGSDLSVTMKGDVLGQCRQKMEPCGETLPEEALGGVSADEADSGANDSLEGQEDQEQEIEWASLTNAASRPRRSSRRRAR